MTPRLPFTWVDAALYVLAAVLLFTLFPAAVRLERDLDWLQRTGVVRELQRLGLTESRQRRANHNVTPR